MCVTGIIGEYRFVLTQISLFGAHLMSLNVTSNVHNISNYSHSHLQWPMINNRVPGADLHYTEY